MLKGSTQSSNSHLCFFYLIYLFTFNFLYESGSVGLFTKIRFGLDVARRYVIFYFLFFQILRQNSIILLRFVLL